MAVKARMDVINLSLGGGVSAWEEVLPYLLDSSHTRGELFTLADDQTGCISCSAVQHC